MRAVMVPLPGERRPVAKIWIALPKSAGCDTLFTLLSWLRMPELKIAGDTNASPTVCAALWPSTVTIICAVVLSAISAGTCRLICDAPV